jgi:hypothetical protein
MEVAETIGAPVEAKGLPVGDFNEMEGVRGVGGDVETSETVGVLVETKGPPVGDSMNVGGDVEVDGVAIGTTGSVGGLLFTATGVFVGDSVSVASGTHVQDWLVQV